MSSITNAPDVSTDSQTDHADPQPVISEALPRAEDVLTLPAADVELLRPVIMEALKARIYHMSTAEALGTLLRIIEDSSM